MLRKSVGVLVGVAFLGACVGFSGCARKAKSIDAAVPETAPAVVKPASLDEGELPLNQDQRIRDLMLAQASAEMQTIYFDYDSSVLKPEAVTRLDRAVEWLRQNPTVIIQIQGHCDERGTDAYNLALGERRALAARRYLIGLGVNPDRIFTISYGEEQPAVAGHGESAWRYNRRDEFRVSL